MEPVFGCYLRCPKQRKVVRLLGARLAVTLKADHEFVRRKG